MNLPFIDFNRTPTLFQTFFFLIQCRKHFFFPEIVLRQRSIDILNLKQILDIGGWAECVPAGRKVSLSFKKVQVSLIKSDGMAVG